GSAYAARRRHAPSPDRAAADGGEEPLQTSLRRKPANPSSRLAQQTAQNGIHRSTRGMDATSARRHLHAHAQLGAAGHGAVGVRILHIGTDSFGGYGGIALYNRELIAAMASHPSVD